MKFTIKDITQNNSWLSKELLNSLTQELISEAQRDGCLDVKLVVNGVELEPKYFNDVMNKLDKFIDSKADVVANKKYREVFEKLDEKTSKLESIITEVTYKIKDEFEINDNDID